MRTTILAITVLGLLAGCRSPDRPGGVDAYEIGRLAAVGYLAGQPVMDVSQRMAVKAAWEAFRSINNLVESDVPALIESELAQEIEDPARRALAVEFANVLWRRLSRRIDFESIDGERTHYVLSEFRRGVEDALEEHSVLLGTE